MSLLYLSLSSSKLSVDIDFTWINFLFVVSKIQKLFPIWISSFVDPNESLMNMMRDMYQNCDPEMKKMIAEAWTKSREETDKMKK